MAVCIRRERQKTKICAGSLRYSIEIHTRSIAVPFDPTSSSVDFGESFTLLAKRRCLVEPIKTIVTFDGISTEKVPTHNFYIRFMAGITAENWIIYKGNRYDITGVTNIDENNLFLQLEARVRGDESKQATYA